MSYLMLLLAMALAATLLASGATLWSQQQRRERETQLLWAGGQIRLAIAAYARQAVPTQADTGKSGLDEARYPASLDDLLLDHRSLLPRRYLRHLYPDPITRSSDWALIRNAAGRIVGVHSRSDEAPIKTGNFSTADASFEGATRYSDWRFSALATAGGVRRPAAGAQPGSASAPGDTGGQADMDSIGQAGGTSTRGEGPVRLPPWPDRGAPSPARLPWSWAGGASSATRGKPGSAAPSPASAPLPAAAASSAVSSLNKVAPPGPEPDQPPADEPADAPLQPEPDPAQDNPDDKSG